MGLDSVELILEAEESFGISLADEEMGRIVTVGQFYDAIVRELPHPKTKLCLSAVTFHKLRQTILGVTGRQREEVRPKSQLEVLVPRRRRRAMWKKMRQLSGLRFPRLCLPMWCVPVILACIAAVEAVGVLVFDWPLNWVLVVPAFTTLLLAYGIADALFGVELPNHFQTVGELTKAVLAKNFATLSAELANYDCNEVWESVRILVADQLGVHMAKVTKESRFAADLGMD